MMSCMVWLMRVVRTYGEGWCVYHIAVGVSTIEKMRRLGEERNNRKRD